MRYCIAAFAAIILISAPAAFGMSHEIRDSPVLVAKVYNQIPGDKPVAMVGGYKLTGTAMAAASTVYYQFPDESKAMTASYAHKMSMGGTSGLYHQVAGRKPMISRSMKTPGTRHARATVYMQLPD